MKLSSSILIDFFPEIFLYFRKKPSKAKKQNILVFFLYFRKLNFLAQNLKNFLYFSLSLSLYIYIYIYREREREKNIRNFLDFVLKSSIF